MNNKQPHYDNAFLVPQKTHVQFYHYFLQHHFIYYWSIFLKDGKNLYFHEFSTFVAEIILIIIFLLKNTIPIFP